MHKITVLVLVAATSLQAAPLLASQFPSAAALPQTAVGGNVLNPAQATISGSVATPSGQVLADATVQARNLLTGQVGGSTSVAAGGQFSIVGLNPGNYVLEVVDASGQIVGTSSFIAAAAGTAVVASVMATSGVLSAVSAATGLVATLGATAARSAGFAAAAAGVAGVVVPPQVPVASPSR